MSYRAAIAAEIRRDNAGADCFFRAPVVDYRALFGWFDAVRAGYDGSWLTGQARAPDHKGLRHDRGFHHRHRLDLIEFERNRQYTGSHCADPIMAMSCHYFLVPDEMIFDNSAAHDKQYVLVERASRGFTACRPEYGDTEKRLFNYIDSWLSADGRLLPH